MPNAVYNQTKPRFADWPGGFAALYPSGLISALFMNEAGGVGLNTGDPVLMDAVQRQTINRSTAGTIPTWTVGRGGAALNFPTGGQHVDGYSTALDPQTWAMWLIPGSTGCPIAKNDGNSVNAGWAVATTTTQLQFLVEHATTNMITKVTPTNWTGWHHVVIVWDGVSLTSSSVKIYVDGVLQAHTSDQDGVGVHGTDGTHPYLVGETTGSFTGFNSGLWNNGTLESVFLFNRQLTVPEIIGLYQASYRWYRPRRVQSIDVNATGSITRGQPGYSLVYRDPSGRRALRWTPDNSRLGDDQMPWAKRPNRNYDPEYLDGLRLGKWTPDNVAIGNDQVPWIHRVRPYEPVYEDGQRLGRWIPDASFLGNDQLLWARRLNRNYDPVYEDGARLGRWIPPNVFPTAVEDMSWSRMRRGYEPVYEDGQRLGRYPHSQVIIPKTFAAQMLLRSATLNRKIFITLKATKATYAGSLTAILAGNSKTFAATAAQKAGSLNRKIFIGAQLNATKAFYQGSLSMKVTHGPPPPPTCIPAACTTIPTIVSHHAICELGGS